MSNEWWPTGNPGSQAVYGIDTQGRMVMNKQYNTPVNLYSDGLVSDTLHNEMGALNISQPDSQRLLSRILHIISHHMKCTCTWLYVFIMFHENTLAVASLNLGSQIVLHFGHACTCTCTYG